MSEGMNSISVEQIKSDQELLELAATDPQLRRLNLQDKEIGDEGLYALSQFRNLRSLNLARTRITDGGLRSLASNTIHLGQLRSLNLGWTWIGNVGFLALTKDTVRLGQLRSLNLANSEVGNKSLIALVSNVSHFGPLRNLDLARTRVGNEGIIALAENASQFDRLRTLNLAQTDISDDGLHRLVESGCLSQLRSLDLSETKISNEGIIALVSQLDQLRSLNLAQTNISNDGLRRLVRSGCLSQLRSFDLSETKISNEGIIALAEKDSRLGLRNLDLSFNLHSLNLERTHVTDAGVVSLGLLEKIQHVNLQGTHINGEGLHALKILKPGLALEYRMLHHPLMWEKSETTTKKLIAGGLIAEEVAIIERAYKNPVSLRPDDWEILKQAAARCSKKAKRREKYSAELNRVGHKVIKDLPPDQIVTAETLTEFFCRKHEAARLDLKCTEGEVLPDEEKQQLVELVKVFRKAGGTAWFEGNPCALYVDKKKSMKQSRFCIRPASADRASLWASIKVPLLEFTD